MIEYLIHQNPDDRIISKAVKALNDGGVIAFTTDTNWVLGASPFSKHGVESLYKIKGINRKKHLSLLVNNISQASKYAVISDSTFKLIRNKIPGPYTFIFQPTKLIPKAISEYRKEKEVGIRFPDNKICQRLIEYSDGPILTTSLNAEMLGLDCEFSHLDVFSYMIEDTLGHTLQMILDPCEYELKTPSSIIDFSSDNISVLRVGTGDVSDFLIN